MSAVPKIALQGVRRHSVGYRSPDREHEASRRAAQVPASGASTCNALGLRRSADQRKRRRWGSQKEDEY